MSRPAVASQTPTSRPRHVRSAVGNGSRLPGGVSAGSAEGRRWADVIHDLTAELGGDLTAAERLQIRTIAGLVVHEDQLHAAVLKGETVDTEQLIRVSNAAARLMNALKRGRAVARKPRGRATLQAEHPLAQRQPA